MPASVVGLSAFVRTHAGESAQNVVLEEFRGRRVLPCLHSCHDCLRVFVKRWRRRRELSRRERRSAPQTNSRHEHLPSARATHARGLTELNIRRPGAARESPGCVIQWRDRDDVDVPCQCCGGGESFLFRESSVQRAGRAGTSWSTEAGFELLIRLIVFCCPD